MEYLKINYAQFKICLFLKLLTDILLVLGILYFMLKLFYINSKLNMSELSTYCFLIAVKILLFFLLTDFVDKITQCL